MEALGMVGNIASSVVNAYSQHATNNTNMRINQMNNEFNERMMQKQMDYNTDMWHKNNEYNSPKEQVARLREAGLNPALALGQVASGQASSQSASPSAANAASPGNLQAPRLDLSGVMDSLRYAMEKNVSDAQADKLKAEAEAQWITNQSLAQTKMAELARLSAETRDKELKNQYQFNLNQWQDKFNQADYQQKLAQTRNIDTQTRDLLAQAIMHETELQALPKMIQLDFAQKAANILQTQEQTNLTKKQAQTEVEKVLESTARQHGFRLDNEIKQRTADAVVEKAIQETLPKVGLYGSNTGDWTGKRSYGHYPK